MSKDVICVISFVFSLLLPPCHLTRGHPRRKHQTMEGASWACPHSPFEHGLYRCCHFVLQNFKMLLSGCRACLRIYLPFAMNYPQHVSRTLSLGGLRTFVLYSSRTGPLLKPTTLQGNKKPGLCRTQCQINTCTCFSQQIKHSSGAPGKRSLLQVGAAWTGKTATCNVFFFFLNCPVTVILL